jgi:hypothetical protein
MVKICSNQGKKEKKRNKYLFKGTLARDFRPQFFFLNRPHLGLFHNLKCFRILMQIRQDI